MRYCQFKVFDGRFSPLRPQSIHVWAIRLDVPPAPFSRLLSADEADRAARFSFDRDARRFQVAHGALRLLLGEYAGAPPRSLQFISGLRGKPALAPIASNGEIHFNLSHSGELALVAVGLQPLGIDVEYKRRPVDVEELARHFFSREEYTELRAQPPEQRAQAFFNCWTRKEAYLKATGEGLSIPLDNFQVTLCPDDEPTLVRVRGGRLEAPHWHLYHLEPLPDYTGALATNGSWCSLDSYLLDPTWLLDSRRFGPNRE